MATYYKYAERSADSQINWAEIGRDMSDMLKEENRIREEKKAAIDAASREFGKTLANPPQGEHKGANQWALEYADNASKYMLMQDKLLKSGQMKLKDYVVARQNILDGTDQAFNLTKEYQANFAEKMERYKTDKSQDLEQWLMAQAEGYSDFNKSQLYINPTDGTLSVAMKEKQIVDGKEVYVMNKNPNQFASVSSLRNQIAGKYDKFNTNAVTDAFVNSLGEEETSIIKQGASLSSGGLILNVEDIRKRTDLSEDGKQILYKFADSENQFIKSTLVNPFDRLSVLTNSKKFAPNGMQYGFTYDEKEAKGNPAKILLKTDPSSGQPTPQFTAEQMKISEDFIRTELRAKYSRKEELRPTPQAQLQERRPLTGGEIDEKKETEDARNFGKNLSTALTGKDPAAVKNAVSYLANKSGKKVNRLGTTMTVSNMDGTEETTFNLDGDPKKLAESIISAFKVGREDKVVGFTKGFMGNSPFERTIKASGFKEVPKPVVVDPMTVYGRHIDTVISDADVAGLSKGEAADALNTKLSGLGVTVKSSNNPFTDNVYVVSGDSKSPDFDVTKAGTVEAIKKWVKANPSGTTPVQKAANIKALVKSGVITSGAGELD